MDYAVGDLLKENKGAWNDLSVAGSWRDYGLGIIIHVDKEKEIAKIYWPKVEVASYYKFRNIRMYLTKISRGPVSGVEAQ